MPVRAWPQCAHARSAPAFGERPAPSLCAFQIVLCRPTTSGCQRAKAAISAVLQLKAAVRAAPRLADALTSTGEEQPRNELLQAVVANLQDPELEAMEARISSIIDDEASFRKLTSQRMLECLFAIRSKVCSFIDVARVSLRDSTTEMELLTGEYAEQYGLTDLKLVWSERRGYHLTLPVAQRAVVEKAGFIKIASQVHWNPPCRTPSSYGATRSCIP